MALRVDVESGVIHFDTREDLEFLARLSNAAQTSALSADRPDLAAEYKRFGSAARHAVCVSLRIPATDSAVAA